MRTGRDTHKRGRIVLQNWAPQRVKAMVSKNASEHLHAVGEFVVAEAKANAPVDTGTLRDNITYTVVPDTGGFVCWVGVKRPAFHASIVEMGASGHTLQRKVKPLPKDPKRRKRVEAARAQASAQASEMTNTQDWFGKPENVQHPGTQAQPYLRPAVWDNAKEIVKIFEKGHR